MLLKFIGHRRMVERGTTGIAGQQSVCIQAGDTCSDRYTLYPLAQAASLQAAVQTRTGSFGFMWPGCVNTSRHSQVAGIGTEL